MKHSNEPWEMKDRSVNGGKAFPETKADAYLIAAAPDLLRALKDLHAKIWQFHKMNVKKDFSLMVADVAASKAIAKAEGLS